MTQDRELLASDWRRPYRTMDAGGGPDTAGVVGWNWIGELAAKERDADAAALTISGEPLGSDGRVTTLYRGTKLLAVATVFRDEMNFAVLVRWRADDAACARREAREGALEEAAAIAENFTREGRDWVPDSLWDNITQGIAAAIRAKGAS